MMIDKETGISFGFVSLYNDISTFMGYLILKPYFSKDSSGAILPITVVVVYNPYPARAEGLVNMYTKEIVSQKKTKKTDAQVLCVPSFVVLFFRIYFSFSPYYWSTYIVSMSLLY